MQTSFLPFANSAKDFVPIGLPKAFLMRATPASCGATSVPAHTFTL